MNPTGIPESYTLTELGQFPWKLPDHLHSLDSLPPAVQRSTDGWSPVECKELEQTPFCALSSDEFQGILKIEGPIMGAKSTGHALRIGEQWLLVQAGEGTTTIIGDTVFFARGTSLVVAKMAVPEVELQELSVSLDLRSIWKNAVEIEQTSEQQLRSLFDGHTIEPWLLAEATMVAEAGHAFSKTAAVGLITRLHEENTRHAQPGDSTTLSIALAWIAQENSSEIETAAIASVARVRRVLAELDQAIEADGTRTEWLARKMVKLRDDLESVCWLLHRVGKGHELEKSLTAFDTDAAAGHSRWLAIRDLSGDLRLSAVSWQFPDLWWSVLGV